MTVLDDPHSYRAGSAELALRAIGLDGARLQKLAHAVAQDHIRKTGAALGDKYEDLVSCLVEAGLKAALRYEPERSGPNYSASSYLWDKMELAIEPEFYRRKREGFGDRRYGHDGRIALVDDFDADEADFDFERLLSSKRLGTWQQAASLAGWEFSEWVAITLDRAARQVLRTAA